MRVYIILSPDSLLSASKFVGRPCRSHVIASYLLDTPFLINNAAMRSTTMLMRKAALKKDSSKEESGEDDFCERVTRVGADEKCRLVVIVADIADTRSLEIMVLSTCHALLCVTRGLQAGIPLNLL